MKVEELERMAANGLAAPDDLTGPELSLFIGLRGLYWQYRKHIIEKDQAKREKAQLIKHYEQAMLGEKCRQKSIKLWHNIPTDLMKSDCPKCQEVGRIIYGLK